MAKFIKPKKVWTKKLSTEEIEALWSAWISAAPLTSDLDGLGIQELFSRVGDFIHPETDKWDESIGFQPKQLRRFIDKAGEGWNDKLEKLFSFVNALLRAPGGHLRSEVIDEDGSLDWEYFWDHYVSAKKSPIEMAERLALKLGMEKLAEFIKSANSIEEVTSALILAPTSVLRGTFAEKVQKQKEAWQAIQGFTPRALPIILANPARFDRKIFAETLKRVYGVGQVHRLSTEEQQVAAKWIDLFGASMGGLDEEFLKTTPLATPVYGDDPLPAVKSEYLRGMNHLETALAVYLVGKDPAFAERLRQGDKEQIQRVLGLLAGMANDLTPNEIMEVVDLFGSYEIGTLSRWGMRSANEMRRLLTIYQNRSQSINIPTVDGKSGSYTYKVLSKDDPMGLVLGYATDCCQVVNHNGESCIRSGFSDPNAGFFVVQNKKGRIVAQSWLWQHETDEGVRILSIDSVEILGKDMNRSADIKKSYAEAIEKFWETGRYDMIVIGWDGNRSPSGLSDLGGIFNVQSILDHVPQSYTDLYLSNTLVVKATDEIYDRVEESEMEEEDE